MPVRKSFMCGWLRGFFDGEGSVFFKRHVAGKSHTYAYLTVSNTDHELMVICQTYLTELGIKWTMWKIKQRPNRKPCETLHVCRQESILKFHRFVGFGAPVKSQKLEDAVEWICRRRLGANLDLDQIKIWHHEDHLSIRQIVSKLGLRPGSHTGLSRAMQAAGIEVFSKSEQWSRLTASNH